ncbi:hypothetical protein AUC43_14405 [Hymenobacter sedentarius]|uniref:Glycosyltransferase RgtA/B/C/D-like domain-containing protein n=1 Tax=Hymenobacter sedentarius TaxID=1411621 RepID=A0A0U4C0Y6_9BACT|nr:hypothetical protein AUC43_14405 [Hymenobacter sedentarius]
MVLSSATWAEARSLDQVFPFYTWHIQDFTAQEFANIRNALAVSAVLLAGISATLAASRICRQEISALAAEVAQSAKGLLKGLKELTTAECRVAFWSFVGLTAIRLYFSIYNPEYDDAVSYEVFVSKGLLATAAYYPIPNNHVFSNTISLLFYQLSPGFWWSMRLPVLLISTAATGFLFAALLRRASFVVALVATSLFCWLQLSLYHAGVGRGYWLLIWLAGIVFFSMVELLAERGRHRAAWASILVAGVVGCYTIPTFVYVLASTFSWLSLAFLRRERRGQLVPLIMVGALIGVATAVLYAPLLLVSGLRIFARNGYVETLAPGVFWPLLPGYLWHNEGFLAGQRTLGPLITLPVLALIGWMFYQARAGKLPANMAMRLRQVGLPALWFISLPYAAILVQRVFPPERVLLYKAFYFFILAGLVVEWVLWQWPVPAHRWPRRAMLTLAGLFALYETFSVVRVNPTARGSNANYHAGLVWLAANPPGRVLIPEPTHNLFFRFYAHTEQRNRNWQIDYQQLGNSRYDYVVAFPNKRGYFQPKFNFPPVFQNPDVEIYRVPQNYNLQTRAWMR